MRGHLTTFWAPKNGHSPKDYEDSSFPGANSDGETRKVHRIRIAVADGATEAFLSSRWADVVARTFGSGTDRCFRTLCHLARMEWRGVVEQYLSERERSGRPLAWFEENRIPEGSATTILTVAFTEARRSSEPGRWWALAVGDSCVFQVRGDRLVASYPVHSSTEFGASPQLLSSRPEVVLRGARTREKHGTFQSDDMFLLCTDAAACWLLKRVEEEANPWEELRDWKDASDGRFLEWLSRERGAARMRNDDVTIVRLEIF